ncbi:TPA: phage tail tape measure protein [Pasteurella multocida]|nr:phage tail tape measure protein [Pasteurella multocida]
MSNLDLALVLKAKDFASRTVKTVRDNVNKSTKDIESQAKRSSTVQQNEIKKTARVSEQAYRQMQQQARSTATARSQLGIRSEQKIQNEILRTEQAYRRLKNSGTASARELARATEQHKRRIAELNAEMGKTTAGQRLGNIGRGVAGAIAGVAAGAMVMAKPMSAQMTYDRQLAMVSNTAFSERDVAGRIAGKKELHNAVKSAVNIGGGTKEDALSALDTLLASGSVSADIAMKLLPTLQKGAVATGASTQDLSKIAISAMQQFGIGENQIGEVLDKAVAAGQAGNFELSDMARWLPQQMAAARSAGLSGMNGFEALLVANQQARVTAGTSDQAGNNLANLLAKITSRETNDRFANLEIKGKDGKTHGVDFIKSMEAQKAKGKNSIEAFMAIMDQVIGEDKNYKELQEKLKTAKKEDQKALLEQMTNLVEGTAIGQIISDKEALLALIGMRNNVQLGQEVRNSVTNSAGAVENSHAVIADTNDFKTEQLKNSAEFAQMESLKGFNNMIGDVSAKLTDYASQYPALSTAIAGAVTGISALSAGAVVAAGSLRLLGGSSGLGLGDALGKGGKGLKGKAGGFFNAGSLALAGLAIAADNHDSYFAQQEAVKEKHEKAQEKANIAMSGHSVNKFQYTPTTSFKTSNVNYHGAYAIADIQRNQAIAKARLNQGTLTQTQYDARIESGNARIAELTQTDLQQFGNQIQSGLKQAVENQQHTIQTHITVELDGRAVAETVSENQYRQFNRE